MDFWKQIIKPVYAHCDVPCGIYETDTMRHAAETCLRMVEKITELGDDKSTTANNNFVRMVTTKERHAQLCKDQIYLLWSDYFKSEHLKKFPDLHDVFWKAAKQCSMVKQTVDMQEAQNLLQMVTHISDIFSESKK